ncbi:MAG: YceI family protein, partial [Pseudomonadota bacterium]
SAITVATSAQAGGFDDVPSGKYTVEDTHAYITFSYSHLGYSNPVISFDDFDVALMLDKDDPTASQLNVNIDPASIDSQVAKFDKHLKSGDMFDVAKHTSITFVATNITMTGDNTMDVTGDLTMKGITKPVTLKTTLNKAAPNPRSKVPTIGISGSAELERDQWDLGYATPFVGNDIAITVEVELQLAEG